MLVNLLNVLIDTTLQQDLPMDVVSRLIKINGYYSSVIGPLADQRSPIVSPALGATVTRHLAPPTVIWLSRRFNVS